MVDGGTFSPSSILSVTSRETKGRTIESLEKAPLSPGSTIGVISLLLGLVGVGFLGGFFFRDAVSMSQETKALRARLDISEEEAARIAALEDEGWRGLESFFKTELAQAYPDSLPIEVGDITRDGNVVTVTVLLENPTEDLLRVSGRLISPAGESTEVFPFDRWVPNHFVMPNSIDEFRLNVFLPPDFPEQLLIGDFSVYSGSEMTGFEKRFEVPE